MSASGNEIGCAYCGLPLGSSERSDVPSYCCFGCRFAAAVAAEQGTEGQPRGTLTRLGLAIFFSMNVMVFTLAMWTKDVYHDASLASPRAQALVELFRYLCLIFAIPVLVLLGGPLLENAVADVRRRVWSTDLLIVPGVAAAFAYSVTSVVTGGRHVYFEVACMVLVAVTLGRWLEATGKQRTTESLRALARLLPERVRVVGRRDFSSAPGSLLLASSGADVPLDQLEIGDVVRVLPGERIAMDGVICRGQAAIDQQLVTGESEPAIKESGDVVLAGMLNLDGDLWIEVRESPHAGTLQRIIDTVEQAALAKSRWQCLADRITAWFVPSVTLVATGVFLVHALSGGLGHGLMSALAVLLIACPCALGIAMPMAVHAAIGQAARRGVLFRNGDALERLATIKAVCFDKTGTLTTGQPTVEQLITDSDTSREQVLDRAWRLGSGSTHALSEAICRYQEGTAARHAPVLERLETFPGRGVSAQLDVGGERIYLGSMRFLQEQGLEAADCLTQALAAARRRGNPVACLGWSGQVRAIFVFREQLRAESLAVLETLRQERVSVAVLTGDEAARAEALGESLGVAVETELLPEDKLARIGHLRAQLGPVAMVGDGINDAPALAAADVGIAMGCGADVSREAAEVCLLGDSLEPIPWALQFSKRTVRIMRQNLLWAFAYNTAGIALAAAGWLNPIWAAVAMLGSSLFVVTNSLRLVGPDAETRAAPPSKAADSTEVSRELTSGPSLDRQAR